MKEIRKKLRSERGASITYALLLFLVCAVVGAVVLVAATSASGRLSGLAGTDQRYYSVTSAAELIRDLYDGAKATAAREEITETITPYTYGGGAQTPVPGSSKTHLYIDGTKIDGTKIEAGYKPDTLIRDAAYQRHFADPAPAYPLIKELSLHEKSSSAAFKGVSVSGEAVLNEDGSLSVTIRSKSADGGSSEQDEYAVRLLFTADERTVEDDRTEEGTAQETAISGADYQITTTKTETVTWTITWKYEGMQTVTGGT